MNASLERPDAQLVAAQRQFCRNPVYFEARAVGLSTERDRDVGFVELHLINRDTSGEQIGKLQGDDQMLEAREISLFSGSFLNDDILGDEPFEGIDCQLADLGLKSLPAESRGDAFLPFIANPNLPEIDDRCGHADKEEEQKQPNRPANEKAWNRRQVHSCDCWRCRRCLQKIYRIDIDGDENIFGQRKNCKGLLNCARQSARRWAAKRDLETVISTRFFERGRHAVANRRVLC